jgi:hypothetical protein
MRAQEVSKEKNFRMLARNPSCDILIKNLAAFCPCLKSHLEAMGERFRFNCIGKQNLKIAFALMKIILMKLIKLRKGKYKMCTSRVKVAAEIKGVVTSPRSHWAMLSSYEKEIKNILGPAVMVHSFNLRI